MNEALYPRLFSDAEYGRRREALEALGGDSGVDAVVVYGDLNTRAAVEFLTGFPPRRDGYYCAAPGTEPTLYVQLYNHVRNAAEMAVGLEVRWGGPESAATVAADMRERVEGLRRVGVIGPIPHRHFVTLQQDLAPAALVDLSADFTEMRLVKSPEEIEATRRAGRLCDNIMDTLVSECVPGMSEADLVGVVGRECRIGGGRLGICFLVTDTMAGTGRYVPAQNPSGRRLSPGDAVVTEMSAGFGGYSGQVLRTIAVAADPPSEFLRLHDVADEAFAAVSALVKPGTLMSELVDAAAVIDEAGFTICDDVVHGYGGGVFPPYLRTPATQVWPYTDRELVAGMMLVVQPNVVTDDLRLGVQTGELLVVTEDGHETIHSTQRGLLRAARTKHSKRSRTKEGP